MYRTALSVAKGVATYLPGIQRLACRTTSGTDSARYCYTVWLRHLQKACERGVRKSWYCAAELGPGDSLGIGLAAMLTGVERYVAIDVRRYANQARNLAVLDELISLFHTRAPIPDNKEFPRVHPVLDDFGFPYAALSESTLERSFSPQRLERIRACLRTLDTRSKSSLITYCNPADSNAALKTGEIDVIFSQAVMEHVDDVEQVYRSCYRWLKPGGVMSHTIGFDSHGITDRWNGHWSISSATWTLIRGRRPWLINRLPCSAHVELMQRAGFRVIAQDKCYDTPLSRDDLSAEFSTLSDEDLRTSTAFVQAVKVIR